MNNWRVELKMREETTTSELNKMNSERKQQTSSRSLQNTLLIVAIYLLSLVAKSTEAHLKEQQRNQNNLMDPLVWDHDTLYGHTSQMQRHKRSANTNNAQQMVDICKSKVEIITPYHATNSKGKLRTIVNSELMQQAVQVETCVRTQSTAKCNRQSDCSCQQKYKWHRLLVLDPHDSGSAKGLFMDWFLFPSSCVCRCDSRQSASKQFLRLVKKSDDSE